MRTYQSALHYRGSAHFNVFLSCKLNDKTVMKHIGAGVDISYQIYKRSAFHGLKMVQHTVVLTIYDLTMSLNVY